MFSIPSRDDITSCRITKEVIDGVSEPVLNEKEAKIEPKKETGKIKALEPA